MGRKSKQERRRNRKARKAPGRRKAAGNAPGEGPEGMRRLYYSDSFRFECIRCGECCANPGMMNVTDFGRISGHLGMGKSEFFERYAVFRSSSMWFREREGYCIMFRKEGDEGACGVHEVKPYNCRCSPIVASERQLAGMVSRKLPGLPLNSYRGTKDVAFARCPNAREGPEILVSDWIDVEEFESMHEENLRIMVALSNMMGKGQFDEYSRMSRAGRLGPGDSLLEYANACLKHIYGIE